MVKTTDLHPENLGSTPAATHRSHWWWQERHQAKTLNKGVNDIKFGWK